MGAISAGYRIQALFENKWLSIGYAHSLESAYRQMDFERSYGRVVRLQELTNSGSYKVICEDVR